MNEEKKPDQSTFTPDQKRAIHTLGRNLCVSAGAGSGKTTVLVERFLYLLEEGQFKINEIAAITFTEKAAGQMKEKIRKKLLDRMERAATPEERRRMETRYREAGSAWIHTIHGLCTRILKEQAVAAGIDPGYLTLDETETLLLLHKTLKSFIVNRLNQGKASMVRLLSAYGLEKTRKILTALVQRRVDAAPWINIYLKQSDEEILRPLFETRKDLETELKSHIARLRDYGADDPADRMEQNRVTALALPDTGPLNPETLTTLLKIDLRVGSKKKWLSGDLPAVKALLKEIKDRAKDLLPLYSEEAIRREPEHFSVPSAGNWIPC
ncbi:MAG: UvrD-helicase domain-containing protein [Deltaproteobacteria bacterium]|nr:UvrD-helicase domain-containing protein [Deltaproteobacteria bacterium]